VRRIPWEIEDLYGSHRTIEAAAMDEPIAKRIGMKRRIQIELGLACCLAVAPVIRAQSAPAQAQTQTKPPADNQKAPAQKSGGAANPFPEDTSNIPVVPTTLEPATTPAPIPDASKTSETTSLLREDTDPIKSPDDPAASSESESGFSSSSQGGDEVNIPAEPEKPGKRQKLEKPVEPQENAQNDESIGAYYLDKKNWKAALSRFESALVLDPENPDVFWGLAEAQRQLGDYANAKANYLKVTEYDPDSKHSKEAKKFLKQPEIANAPAVSANHPEKPQ
jgi:tetratricopeptide (TPR) repeat protein